MHHDVDELHAGHHEVDLEALGVREVVHEGLEAVIFTQFLLKIIKRPQDDVVAALHEAYCG